MGDTAAAPGTPRPGPHSIGTSLAVTIGLSWSVAATVTHQILRAPLPSHPLSITPGTTLGALILGWAAILSVPLVLRILGSHSLGHPFALSAPAVPFAILWAVGPGAPVAATVGIVTILVAGVAATAQSLARGGLWTLGAAMAGAVGGYAQTMAMAVSGKATPFALETTIAGVQNDDTMFHSSLAGFLTKYGIATTGFDGLVPLQYHLMSHRIIGAFGAWMSTAPINAYSLFVPIVAAPLAIFLLLWVVERLHGHSAPSQALAWALAMLGLVYAAVLFGGRHIWVSESFLVSVPPLLAAIGVMATAPAPAESAGRDAAIAVLLASLLALASLTKISTGAVLASGICLWFALRHGFGRGGIVLAVLAGAAPFLAVHFGAPVDIGHADASLFGPFTLFAYAPEKTLFHLGFVALVLALAATSRASKAGSLALALAAMAVVAQGVALLIDLEGTSAMYFASAGLWPCFALLALRPPHLPGVTAVPAQALLALSAVAFLWSIQASDGITKSRVLERQREFALAGLPGTSRLWPVLSASRDVDGLYISEEAEIFWKSFQACYSGLLALPSITATPFVLGLPGEATGCETSRFFSFGDYDREVSTQRPLDDAELCEVAAARDMVSVAVIGAGYAVRRLNCSG